MCPRSLCPEDGGCAAPTVARVLAVFDDLARQSYLKWAENRLLHNDCHAAIRQPTFPDG